MFTVLALVVGCDDASEAGSIRGDDVDDAAADAAPAAGELAAPERNFGYVLGRDGRPARIEFEVRGGIAVMGGDAQLGPVSQIAATPAEALAAAGSRTMYGGSARWPDGLMPFALKPGLDPVIAQAARDAAEHYNKFTEETGVRLEEVEPEFAGDHVFVVDADDPAEVPGAGCYVGVPCSERIGYMGGRQRVWLSILEDGDYKGSIWQVAAHEFGHALGQYHEHSRPERVDYLSGNIPEWHDLARFGEYDTQSIMHYSVGEFEAQGMFVTFKPGVAVPPPKLIHPGLVPGDRASLAEMYGPKGKQNITPVSFMDGRCARVGHGEGSGTPYMEACGDGEIPEQRFVYDPLTHELRDHYDWCLDSTTYDWWDDGMPTTRPCSGVVGQRWTFDTFGQIQAESETLGLKPRPRCLTILDHDRSDSNLIVLEPCHRGDNQAWRISPTGIGGAVFNLGNDPGKCADAESADTGVQLWLWDCDDENPNQRVVRGAAGELMIHGKCVDGHDGKPGDPVRLWDCHGGENQRWDRDSLGRLVSHTNPEVCVDVDGAPTANKSLLTLQLCADVAAQKWTYLSPDNP